MVRLAVTAALLPCAACDVDSTGSVLEEGLDWSITPQSPGAAAALGAGLAGPTVNRALASWLILRGQGAGGLGPSGTRRRPGPERAATRKAGKVTGSQSVLSPPDFCPGVRLVRVTPTPQPRRMLASSLTPPCPPPGAPSPCPCRTALAASAAAPCRRAC